MIVDDQMLLTIGNWRKDGKFAPFPQMSIERVVKDGNVYVFIVVEPSSDTPVRYEGRSYIRVGPQCNQATAEEERRLVEKRKARDLPFDAKGLGGAEISDLDEAAFKLVFLPSSVPQDVIAQNGRSYLEQLRALRLVDAKGIPTPVGILAIAKSPQDLIPGAYIQALRIDGDLLTDSIIDQHSITGTLTDQINRAEELVSLWITTASKVGGPRRQDKANYPIEALRQLIRNAVMHRNYDGANAPVRLTWYNDRIELQNPGGLFGQVTKATMGKVTDYRNPTLAAAMKSLGYVERFGLGIQIVNKQLAENGNPPAEFEITPSHINVTVRRAL